MDTVVKKVSISNLDDLIGLFDQYMVFYNKPSSPNKYKEYLTERIVNKEAMIFIAYTETDIPVGFVLNYFSFSSVSQGSVVVLNDLFVSPDQRNKGIGNALISSSVSLAKETGAVRVGLATAKDNLNAQVLYEKMGFVKDADYFYYNFSTK